MNSFFNTYLIMSMDGVQLLIISINAKVGDDVCMLVVQSRGKG